MIYEVAADDEIKVGDWILSRNELSQLIQKCKQEPDVFMTTEDVCKMFQVSRTTVYKMMREKKIPHYQFGATIRFKKSELIEMCVPVPVEG